jgi:hypothetical protein
MHRVEIDHVSGCQSSSGGNKVRAAGNEAFKVAGIAGLIHEEPVKAAIVLDG